MAYGPTMLLCVHTMNVLIFKGNSKDCSDLVLHISALLCQKKLAGISEITVAIAHLIYYINSLHRSNVF